METVQGTKKGGSQSERGRFQEGKGERHYYTNHDERGGEKLYRNGMRKKEGLGGVTYEFIKTTGGDYKRKGKTKEKAMADPPW